MNWDRLAILMTWRQISREMVARHAVLQAMRTDTTLSQELRAVADATSARTILAPIEAALDALEPGVPLPQRRE